MKTASIQTDDFLKATRKPTRLDRLARRIVRSRLEFLREGQITISEGGQYRTYGEATTDMPLAARIVVKDPRFYSEIAFGGVIGSGEAFIHDYWSCEELTALVRILVRNRDMLSNMDSGAARLTQPLQKLFHWLNRNTRAGSRQNIAAHYDLGNDFYALWLDETMMYSSAIYEREDMTLAEASTAKLDRICRRLKLKPDDHVVEIGTGWGGFAIHAAKNYGCRVTTTTISEEQHAFASAAVAAAGLEDRITLLFDDYRDLEGQYDKLVSIEMIEAVGWEFHDRFFAKCSSLLKPDGQMLLQAITIADQHFERYKKGVDFIRRYIFPGGCLTSVTGMAKTLTEVTDMRIAQLEAFGPHYATTLREWRENFDDQLREVRKLGYSDEFIRMWTFYLCYCEGAFLERAIGVVHMHVIKPDARIDVIDF